jgi:hypothetical protein
LGIAGRVDERWSAGRGAVYDVLSRPHRDRYSTGGSTGNGGSVLEATANDGRDASTEERVEQILARMTLEEKTALMYPRDELGDGLAY